MFDGECAECSSDVQHLLRWRLYLYKVVLYRDTGVTMASLANNSTAKWMSIVTIVKKVEVRMGSARLGKAGHTGHGQTLHLTRCLGKVSEYSGIAYLAQIY